MLKMLKIELSTTAVKNSFHQRQNTLHKTVSTQSSILLFRNVDTTHASEFFFLKRRDGQIASSQYFIRFMAIQKYQEISFMTLDLSSGLQVLGQMIRNAYILIIINQIKYQVLTFCFASREILKIEENIKSIWKEIF